MKYIVTVEVGKQPFTPNITNYDILCSVFEDNVHIVPHSMKKLNGYIWVDLKYPAQVTMFLLQHPQFIFKETVC